MLPLIPQDKANHVCYGAAITAAVAVVRLLAGATSLNAVLVAMAVVTVVAGVKELMDRRDPNHTPEWMDFAATVAGGVLVVAPVLAGGL